MSTEARELLRRLKDERSLAPAVEDQEVHIMPAGYPEHMSTSRGLHLVVFLLLLCLLFALWKRW